MPETSDGRLFYAATTRNREPIFGVLINHVAAGARVLEIASGSGEHAVFLAPRLQVASWQPSDPDAPSRRSIDAWAAHEGATMVRPALELDVTRPPWPAGLEVDLLVCVNMIHIAPWAATEALFDRAREVVVERGLVYLYGPYKRGGAHTAPSNESFDASLRARNAAWGVRDLEQVLDVARDRGFELVEVLEMPANNLSVVLRAS